MSEFPTILVNVGIVSQDIEATVGPVIWGDRPSRNGRPGKLGRKSQKHAVIRQDVGPAPNLSDSHGWPAAGSLSPLRGVRGRHG